MSWIISPTLESSKFSHDHWYSRYPGRLCRFTAIISDRPEGLATLASLIASTGASIKDIAHDRAFSGADVTIVRAVCVVETTDHQHVEKLLQVIRQTSIKVIPGLRDFSLEM